MMNLSCDSGSRRIIVREKAVTDPGFGTAPDDRPVQVLLDYGVVVIDKPEGPTSHQVSAYVQDILGIKKSGHSGTLDPAVTGVLPVALGRATRTLQALLPAGKEYVCIMHLHKIVPEDILRSCLKEFTGTISQLPPIRSSVKRQLRERSIYYLDILEIDGKDVLFRAGVQAGTYIRKLCHDIGQKLSVGAHMAQLRRTRAGPFAESEAVFLQDLADAFWYFKNKGDESQLRKCILPAERCVDHLPKIWLFDSTVDPICHGSSLGLPGVSKFNMGISKGGIVALMTLKNELIALAKASMASDDMVAEKGIAASPIAVLMKPGSYPKYVKE